MCTTIAVLFAQLKIQSTPTYCFAYCKNKALSRTEGSGYVVIWEQHGFMCGTDCENMSRRERPSVEILTNLRIPTLQILVVSYISGRLFVINQGGKEPECLFPDQIITQSMINTKMCPPTLVYGLPPKRLQLHFMKCRMHFKVKRIM